MNPGQTADNKLPSPLVWTPTGVRRPRITLPDEAHLENLFL